MPATDARRLAFTVLTRVEEGAFADLSLDIELERHPGLERRERALATELVYGSLRQRARLDFALGRFCRQPLARVEGRVLTLLRLGAYQLLLLDRIPAPAAVHATVELAKGSGLGRAAGFINGILRALLRGREAIPWPDPEAAPLPYLEQMLSLPPWLARRWLRELGASEAMALGAALLQPAPFTLRVNTLKTDRTAFMAALREAGHEGRPTTFAPEGVQLIARGEGALPGADAGWFQVQDEASMLIAHLLAPRPGERLLDACAAPGGKTTHLAALAGNEAQILALDLHEKRTRLVAQGAERLGCTGIRVAPCDLSRPPANLAPASFDRVLVDAPCSGLGVLRRNPELRWRRTPEDISRLARLQLTILENVAPLVRPGGCLLYSLCTRTPEETEGVVARLLAAHPEFCREDLRTAAPAAWASLFDENGALATAPHRHGGMDGFYAVRLRRTSG